MKIRYLSILAALFLVGIFIFHLMHDSEHVNVNAKGVYEYEAPNFKRVSDLGDENLYYIVDENTNIVYVVMEGINGRGISVAYNEDGSVMHEQDLVAIKR